jgi:hypothetical protein
MKKFVFLPVAVLALAACSDTNPLSPNDSTALAGKLGAAKQGTAANLKFAQWATIPNEWTTQSLSNKNSSFTVNTVNGTVQFRWVLDAVPSQETVTITPDAGYSGLAAYGSYSDGDYVAFNSSNPLCAPSAGTPLACEQEETLVTSTFPDFPFAMWGGRIDNVVPSGNSYLVTFTPRCILNKAFDTPVCTTSVMMAWRGVLATRAASNGASMTASVPDARPDTRKEMASAIN